MKNSKILHTKLYETVASRRNIYAAIYSLNSYIFERALLNKGDIERFSMLQDKFNFTYINSIIKKCQDKLERIFTIQDEFFIARVVFKAKKYDCENKKTIFRPMHTADLVSQICMVSMLNCVMFNDSSVSGRTLSNISALLPSNFYGNMPSDSLEEIFVDWKENYKKYSEDIEFKYNECMSTGEYSYQVKFDLENFFPSVNPEIIYNMIILKLSTRYANDEYEALKTLLYKLLYLKISGLTSIEVNDYYSGKLNNSMVRGIPQGLPQSYFFGNLCMAEIAKCYQGTYPGEAFFYVDDSVIFTKEVPGIESDFPKKIESLNTELNNILKKYEGRKDFPISSQRIIANVDESGSDYVIKIHGSDKSSIEPISDKDRNRGQGYLKNVAIDASRVGFEFRRTLNESEEFTLKEKIQVWLDGINAEINRITTSETANNTAYLRSLTRYKKYFKYRLRVIDFGFENSDFEKYLNDFKVKCRSWIEDSALEEIFEEMDADIFLPEACMLMQFSNSEKTQAEIIELVKKIEHKLFGDIYEYDHLYFYNTVANTIANSEDIKYRSLAVLSKKQFGFSAKKNEEAEINELSKLASQESCEQHPPFIPDYTHFIFDYSQSLNRMIINAKLSCAINVELSDASCFSKKNGYTLKYFELRLLMIARNRYFQLKEDMGLVRSILEDAQLHKSGSEKMDYSIIEVLDHFRAYVKLPAYVDQLILAHQYVAGIWRNGSKFLYFYTLHSQEHSVELIKLSITVTKTIDYLQIKEYDYFILFLACYLHDISMVRYPDMSSFLKDGVEADCIYTKWLEDVGDAIVSDSYWLEEETKIITRSSLLADASKAKIKSIIIEYFGAIDSYFENNLRNQHAPMSGTLIRNERSLAFLDIAVRTLVAEVSVAHGYNSNDIYSLKSVAKDNTVSLKYLMIILRLSDLLDMTKDRVSMNLLKQNILNMPAESKFHWISHSVIEKCVFRTEYQHIAAMSHNESHLDRNRFHEEFVVEIYLNSKITTSVKQRNCHRLFAAAHHETADGDITRISIKPSVDDSKCSDCIFICKWMREKNSYLFGELEALKQYLERSENNIFKTSYRVDLKFEHEMPLEAQHLDCIQTRIDLD